MPNCPACRAPNPSESRFCGRCGSALDAAPRPVEGERRRVTVVFADVADSTRLAAALDPEDWAAVMNGAFGFMNVAVTQYDGTVARLMGDAVLAFFGAPRAHEDDAERAVLAALAMREAARDYARALRSRHGIDFALRIGIHTGVSVLAVVGDEIRTEYTAMGDAVNLASRLQGLASPGSILLSADTHRLVRARFAFAPPTLLQIKGRSEPLETFEVRGTLDAPGTGRGIEGLRSPLVGRDEEFGRLWDRVSALAQGRGSVVAVVGEAGVGKSRLLAEVRSAARDFPMTWYEGRGVSYGQATAYHPWQQIGRGFIGAEPGDAPEAVRARLHDFVARLGLPEGDLPFFEVMLAVDTEASRRALDGLDRDTVVHGVADAVLRSLRAAIRAEGTGERPHLLVFDDLHWADPASLELISQVSTLSRAEPLLLIGILRPERHHASWSALDRWERSLGGAFTRIDLGPLEAGEAEALLENLLHVEALPEEVRALIVKRSDGNPFFLEEVLRSLIDSGHVIREGGRWLAVQEISTVTIPETLTGVLSARIDRLPDTTRRVAQTASVLGRIFPYRALSVVCGRAEPRERIEHVEPHLGTLTYEELVRERAQDPEREYIFKHALTRDVAYDLLLKARRREIHRRVGEVLEELYPERHEELAPVLAYHFSEGADPVRAAMYALRAGARAMKLYALDEALAHYELALDVLEGGEDPNPTLRFEVILAWAGARSRAMDYTGVVERLKTAEAIARGSLDAERIARVLNALASVQVLTGFPSRAIPYLMESQELARDLGDETLMMLPFFVATETLLDRDPRGSLPKFVELIELARRHRQRDIEGHAWALKALAHARLGEFTAAEAAIEEALGLAPRVGSPVKEADVHIVVGMALLEMGELDRAMEHGRRGAELAESVGAMECACAGHLGVGQTLLEQKELDAALAGFERSLDLADSVGGFEWMNRIEAGLAAARFEEGGDPERALADLEGALANARKERDVYLTAGLAERLGRAYLRLGRLEEAETHVDAALEEYARMEMKPSLARALELSAELMDRRERGSEAVEARARASALRAGFRGTVSPSTPASVGGA